MHKCIASKKIANNIFVLIFSICSTTIIHSTPNKTKLSKIKTEIQYYLNVEKFRQQLIPIFSQPISKSKLQTQESNIHFYEVFSKNKQIFMFHKFVGSTLKWSYHIFATHATLTTFENGKQIAFQTLFFFKKKRQNNIKIHDQKTNSSPPLEETKYSLPKIYTYTPKDQQKTNTTLQQNTQTKIISNILAIKQLKWVYFQNSSHPFLEIHMLHLGKIPLMNIELLISLEYFSHDSATTIEEKTTLIQSGDSITIPGYTLIMQTKKPIANIMKIKKIKIQIKYQKQGFHNIERLSKLEIPLFPENNENNIKKYFNQPNY